MSNTPITESVLKKIINTHCLIRGILDDYCSTISKLTGENEANIRNRVIEKSNLYFTELKEEYNNSPHKDPNL